MSDKEIDHQGTDEVVCPHCGAEHVDSWEFFTENRNNVEIECCQCGKEFEALADYSVVYYTSKPKEEA